VTLKDVGMYVHKLITRWRPRVRRLVAVYIHLPVSQGRCGELL
jgi:hypothetical protein